MSVTIINAGSQHNVVPATCTFTVDVRVTDAYRNEEVLEIIRQHVSCDVTPRSIRLKPSSIDKNHPFVQAGIAWAETIRFAHHVRSVAAGYPSIKVGPGDSAAPTWPMSLFM
jgi:acetylornithine deacetylase